MDFRRGPKGLPRRHESPGFTLGGLLYCGAALKGAAEIRRTLSQRVGNGCSAWHSAAPSGRGPLKNEPRLKPGLCFHALSGRRLGDSMTSLTCPLASMKGLEFCAPKGHRSIAQGLPWVGCYIADRPEGAPEIGWKFRSCSGKRFSAAPSGRAQDKKRTQAKAWAMLSWPLRPQRSSRHLTWLLRWIFV